MMRLDSASGNYKKSLEDLKIYTIYKDSLLSEASLKQTTEMKAKYESEKNEKEIALLTKDNEIQTIEINKQKQIKYSLIGGLTFFILVVLLGYRSYRSRQILRLQEIRNKISADLHDDIGSTLNSISVFSEVARRKDELQDEALEMIGDSTRKVIDSMSDIVWAINPENDSFAKIIFRMKSLAYNLFRAKKIEYTFVADESLNEKKLSLEERRSFYLIFKEAVNNLVKYSGATNASITLSYSENKIHLKILDNGAGFDLMQDNAGNGLKNMKRRADEIRAQLKIESGKGNGTQVDLVLRA